MPIVDGSLVFVRPTNWTHSSIYESPAVIHRSTCFFSGVGILEKLVRLCKQVAPPNVNHFHHVVCFDEKLRNRPRKMQTKSPYLQG